METIQSRFLIVVQSGSASPWMGSGRPKWQNRGNWARDEPANSYTLQSARSFLRLHSRKLWQVCNKLRSPEWGVSSGLVPQLEFSSISTRCWSTQSRDHSCQDGYSHSDREVDRQPGKIRFHKAGYTKTSSYQPSKYKTSSISRPPSLFYYSRILNS